MASSAFHPAIKVPATKPETGGAGHDTAEKFPMPIRIAIILGLGLISWVPIVLLLT